MINRDKTYSDQEKDELIAVFCGGKLETNPLMGNQYRFDEQGTPKHMMKCPPFGVVSRNGMRWSCDYNWLMRAVKECYEKSTINDDLDLKYHEIVLSLTEFEMINPYLMTHMMIIEFIELYNDRDYFTLVEGEKWVNRFDKESNHFLENVTDVLLPIEKELVNIIFLVKALCINIIIEKGTSDCISSIPNDGIVYEYSDRYEYVVTHAQGISEIKIYKKDCITVEILHKEN